MKFKIRKKNISKPENRRKKAMKNKTHSNINEDEKKFIKYRNKTKQKQSSLRTLIYFCASFSFFNG
jgi:hypothetical protein